MPIMNLIIKPTDLCNLKCEYCYHQHFSNCNKIIDFKYVEKLFTLCTNNFDKVEVVWHGGEPLLVGIEFYKKVVRLQWQLYKKTRCRFYNSIQTNATLIDEKWIRFFKKYKFYVGVSYDGLNNSLYRQETKKTEKSLRLLKKHKCGTGILSVVTAQNSNMTEMYRHSKLLTNTIKFNPVFSENEEAEYLLNVIEYINQLRVFWDVWAYDTDGIPIEPFVSYASKVLGVPGFSACTMNSCLGKWIDMDSVGDLRFCGQSNNEYFVVGNIEKIESIDDIFNGPEFNKILKDAIALRKKCKETCKWFKLCQGGCLCQTIIESPKSKGFFCTVTKNMLDYIQKSLNYIISSNTPLDALNPTIRNLIANSMTVSEDFKKYSKEFSD